MKNSQTNHFKIDINEYFQNLHDMIDEGINLPSVSPPLKLHGSLSYAPIQPISSNSFNSLQIQQPTSKKKVPMLPKQIILSCLPPNLLPLTIPDNQSCGVIFESTASNWEDKTDYFFFYNNKKKYFVDNIFERTNHLFFRFQYNNKVAIDRTLSNIAVFPNKGICNHISECLSFKIKIHFSLNPEFHDLLEKHSVIPVHFIHSPDFFKPDINTFEIHKQEPVDVMFTFSHIKPYTNKVAQIKLHSPLIETQSISIPIRLNYVMPPLSLSFYQPNIKKTIVHGGNMTIECPFSFAGTSGKLNLYIFGNGISEKKEITHFDLQTHNKFSLTLDTKKIFPMHNKPLSLFIINNSDMINQRFQHFSFDISVVRIFSYPESGLYFKEVPWQSIHAKTLRFIRSDYVRNIKSMYIRIPLAYQRFIRVIKSRKDADLAKFVFDFSKVDANKSKQGEIPIIVTCADGLVINFNLPFQFSTYAASPETPFQCPDWKCGKSEELYIHLHNNTSTPFEVQDIKWKKNNFTRKLQLSEINDQFPVRLENSSKTIRFQPIIKGSWYKEVVINDILQIKSNLKDCPVFEKEYTIRLSRNKWYYRILKKFQTSQ